MAPGAGGTGGTVLTACRVVVPASRRARVGGLGGAFGPGLGPGQRGRASPSGSRRTAAASCSASTSSSSGPIPALKRNGAWSCGRGSSAARRARCSSWSRKRRARNSAAARSAAAWSSVRVTPTSAAASSGSRSRPGSAGRQALTMTGPERDADPVLERVGGLDDLVDRHLLGQGHEGHLASIGVRQQLDDVGGLDPHRARAGRVHEALGRGQKRHGVAGGGGVHQDQVGGALALEALHLAQDEDVPDAGDGRRHHVERPRRHQALGDPLHPVVGEVLEQGVVGGDPPGPHRPAARERTPRPESWDSS